MLELFCFFVDYFFLFCFSTAHILVIESHNFCFSFVRFVVAATKTDIANQDKGEICENFDGKASCYLFSVFCVRCAQMQRNHFDAITFRKEILNLRFRVNLQEKKEKR